MRTASVRALERGLAILEYLNKRNGARITDIMSVIGAPHATTYRLLKTLRDQGLLTKGGDRGEYWLASGVKALSSGYKVDAWLTDIVMPVIQDVAAQLHWPVLLMQPRGTAMVVRARSLAACPSIKSEIPTGSMSEMTDTAGGLAYLAHTEFKLPLSAEALRKLADVRRKGYAGHDEGRAQIAQLAVPLQGADGLWGALMARHTAPGATDKVGQDTIVQALTEAARALSPHLFAPLVMESAKPVPKRRTARA